MKKLLWALFDDRTGSVGQAKGIIMALKHNLDVVEKKIVYTRWAALPNFIRGKSLLGVNIKESSSLKTNIYPDLVLSVSRRTLPIARYIRKMSGNKTKIIQLMYPGKTGIKDIELLILSEHDRKKNSPQNFFYITGCPHRASTEVLKNAKKDWESVFAPLPRPWTTVIIGGAIKGKPFSVDNARLLAQEILDFKQKQGGSILITTSRRTGDEPQNVIMAYLKDIPAYTFLWGEKKENPYMGFLACADNHVVTGDTVSMCSEVCSTGKPVFIFRGHNWLTKKHLRFVQSLFDGGYAVALEDENAFSFTPSKRLDCANLIANKILEIR